MEIIPAIDIIDGKCVRLSAGDYSRKTIYQEDPLEMALKFEAVGIKRLHMVDLDGAGGKSLKNLPILEKIAGRTSLILDFGGGIKTSPAVQAVLDAGAAMVNVGSVIVKDPGLFSVWISDFGPGKFLPGADVLDKMVKIHGWKEDTGIHLMGFLSGLIAQGFNEIFCTDISRDGMMQGPSISLYKEILENYPQLHLIASGGVSRIEDLYDLRNTGCKGAIVGKSIYEGKISTEELVEFIKEN